MHGLGIHESDWPTPFRQGIGMMQRKALRSAAHVFCTDARTREAIRRLRDQADILSSGVDPAQFDRAALPRPREYEDGAFTVLWVGRLAKVKGIETMLEAMKLVERSERERMRFVFIGDGPYRADLLRTASSVKEIRFLGQVDHSGIAPYVAHADAFVLPSLSEGLPISLLEAMAAGVPAVATDVGGISSQIDREALALIPPGEPRKLAEAVARLQDDRAFARKLGERGKAHVSAQFSWDGVVDRIEEAYGRLSAP
jgi:glycosyltransferase involved in cell wall biosynthesis